MSDRTWEDIGNEIRDDYLRADGPENINFREVQWDLWLAEVERAAAARALEEAEATLERVRALVIRAGTYGPDEFWEFKRDLALAALAAVERVRVMHRPESNERYTWCVGCSTDEYPEDWPCPTAVALGLSEGGNE